MPLLRFLAVGAIVPGQHTCFGSLSAFSSLDTMSIADKSRSDGILAGIVWMILTTFCFAGVTGIVRYIGSDIPAVEAAFIRYALGLLLFLPWIRQVARNLPSGRTLKLYTVRGLVHGFAVILWFYAMARIPMAEVTALGYLAPIFVTIGAALFLGERLHLRRMTAVAVGFIGTIVILRPGFHEIGAGQIAQLLATPLFAASFLLAKRLTGEENPMMIVIMLSIFCTLALLPGALYVWSHPSLSDLFWLGITAIVATLGHYTMTRAIQAAPMTVTQPVTFLQLVWAAMLGVAVFAEPIDPWVLTGGGIVVAAVTFISHRERVAARHQVTPPAELTKD